MSEPLLQTKLYIPPARPDLVPRPRLIERLNVGFGPSHSFVRKLVLISAPAGFGKTTLVSEWVQARGGATPSTAVAWLSLDESDNDLTRFLAYLVAALQTIAANIGERVLDELQSPQPVPTESILTALLNEITTISDNFVLVLDDYHVFDMYQIHQDATLLETSVENEAGYIHNGERLPQINVSASRDEAGTVHISLCNLDPKAVAEVKLTLAGVHAIGQVSGQILTAGDMTAHNTFSQPENVKPAAFQSFSTNGQVLTVRLVPMSVTVLELADSDLMTNE